MPISSGFGKNNIKTTLRVDNKNGNTNNAKNNLKRAKSDKMLQMPKIDDKKKNAAASQKRKEVESDYVHKSFENNYKQKSDEYIKRKPDYERQETDDKQPYNNYRQRSNDSVVRRKPAGIRLNQHVNENNHQFEDKDFKYYVVDLPIGRSNSHITVDLYSNDRNESEYMDLKHVAKAKHNKNEAKRRTTTTSTGIQADEMSILQYGKFDKEKPEKKKKEKPMLKELNEENGNGEDDEEELPKINTFTMSQQEKFDKEKSKQNLSGKKKKEKQKLKEVNEENGNGEDDEEELFKLNRSLTEEKLFDDSNVGKKNKKNTKIHEDRASTSSSNYTIPDERLKLDKRGDLKFYIDKNKANKKSKRVDDEIDQRKLAKLFNNQEKVPVSLSKKTPINSDSGFTVYVEKPEKDKHPKDKDKDPKNKEKEKDRDIDKEKDRDQKEEKKVVDADTTTYDLITKQNQDTQTPQEPPMPMPMSMQPSNKEQVKYIIPFHKSRYSKHQNVDENFIKIKSRSPRAIQDFLTATKPNQISPRRLQIIKVPSDMTLDAVEPDVQNRRQIVRLIRKRLPENKYSKFSADNLYEAKEEPRVHRMRSYSPIEAFNEKPTIEYIPGSHLHHIYPPTAVQKVRVIDATQKSRTRKPIKF